MPQKILRLKKVMEQTGLSRSAIYLLMSLNAFPKNIKLTKRSVGWIEADIDSWIQKQIDYSIAMKKAGV